jgi:hypothetical protein
MFFPSHYYADLNYEEVPLGLEMEETNGNDITADALWML